MLFALTSAEAIYAGLGWPRPRVSTGEINQLYYVYMSWKDVALHLRVSARALERRRNEFKITVSDRTGNRSTYTIISDEELYTVVMEVLETLPDAGNTYFIVACRQRSASVHK